MPLSRWILLCLFVALTGVLYMVLFTDSKAYYIGAIYALACSLPLILFESGRLLPGLHARIQKLSTPAYFGSTLLAYLVLTGTGLASQAPV